MAICYSVTSNYGLSIILLTFISKIILLPVSVWVHKNSIKMIKLTPEMNNVKVRFFGDNDRIAEEQSKLYKRAKYNPLVNIIPLILQIVILMSIIEVIYHPMNYLLNISQNIIDSFINLGGQISSINIESSSVQLSIIDLIKDKNYINQFLSINFDTTVIKESVSSITQLNMNFFGFNLSNIPNTVHGITVVIPVFAGFSSWLLSHIQNKINILQSQESNFSKYGMMAFSIAISLFLGWFVPVGVGVYWISSNMLTIVQTIILNKVLDPKKHIDYDALELSKKELNKYESLEAKSSIFKNDPNKKREKQDYKRFFSIANKHIVFYSESNGFYKYFKGILEYLIDNTNLNIHYITNDPNDAIFDLSKENTQIKPYYIGQKRIITLMMQMDADIVIMTTPDLETYHIKKSYVKKDIEYIYIQHTITSVHMTLSKTALNNFDTIFCVGEHQIQEIRAMEKLYNLREKNLIPVGYELLENLISSHENNNIQKIETKQVLIAPSWQEGNILDNGIEQILTDLKKYPYTIIIRPHPEYVKRYNSKINLLKEKYKNEENVVIEDDFSTNNSVFSSNILITDWSNVGFEFSYATKKPSLYINTPMKVMNTEYDKIGIVPLDISLRDIVGKSLSVDDLNKVGQTVEYLLDHQSDYSTTITQTVDKYIFNLGSSSEIGGNYIIQRLKERQKKEHKNDL